MMNRERQERFDALMGEGLIQDLHWKKRVYHQIRGVLERNKSRLHDPTRRQENTKAPVQHPEVVEPALGITMRNYLPSLPILDRRERREFIMVIKG